ncbi:MAG: TetR/AcrR family transcriptional regulator [Candidatus Sulfotelmatobacter sp.]|jgi:AcrR family transcriptional regulator
MASTLATRKSSVEGVGERSEVGLRQRKKARLRQQIIETSIKLFRKHGYEETRIDDVVQALEISQPTFFRYFPSKDAVLREVGERGYACICERLRSELSSNAATEERLRRLYVTMAREVETDRRLWQAVVLSGAMDPVRSAELRGHEEAAASLLRDILTQGQKRGEVTRAFPVVHLAEFMEGLYNTVVRQWAVDLTGPHKLTERVRSAVEFFLRGIRS